jgi:nucleotide-binding universal stress UspA family protein
VSSSKMLVGVDGSDHSIRAVTWCAGHAAALDAEVIPVHAIDLPTSGRDRTLSLRIAPADAVLPALLRRTVREVRGGRIEEVSRFFRREHRPDRADLVATFAFDAHTHQVRAVEDLSAVVIPTRLRRAGGLLGARSRFRRPSA